MNLQVDTSDSVIIRAENPRWYSNRVGSFEGFAALELGPETKIIPNLKEQTQFPTAPKTEQHTLHEPSSQAKIRKPTLKLMG